MKTNVINFPADDGWAEALRRIRLAAETDAAVLDLGDLGLIELPSELASLAALRHLCLGQCVLSLSAQGALSRQFASGRRPIQLLSLDPVGQLSGLESLDLTSAIRLEDLSPFETLANLKRLWLSDTRGVQDYTPVGSLTSLESLDLKACEGFSDLETISALRRLQVLSLAELPAVANLEPLSTLHQLTSLSIRQCPVVEGFDALKSLQALETLQLRNCWQLSSLGWLKGLTKLKELWLRDCPFVTDLSPIRYLSSLSELHLTSSTAISDLRPLRHATNLTTLDLEESSGITSLEPLTSLPRLKTLRVSGSGVSVPAYLSKSGDASAILAWLEGVSEGFGPVLPEVKLLVLGQGRVGKTHLIRRLLTSHGAAYHDARLDRTPNIERLIAETESEAHRTSLRIWDFGGQSHLHSAHRFFLGAERCFYLLVLAADRPADGEGPDSNRLSYWLRMIAHHSRTDQGERAPVLIVVTRSDEPAAHESVTRLESALTHAKSRGWFGANVIEVIGGMGWSCTLDLQRDQPTWRRHTASLDRLHAAITESLDQVPGFQSPIPPACRAIKSVVEEAFYPPSFAPYPPHLTPKAAFFTRELLELEPLRHEPSGDSNGSHRQGLLRATLELLNSLGVAHWVGGVPEIERRNPWGIRDVVFNPEWVKRPVYDLLWHTQPRESKAGLLTERDIREILPTRPSNPRAVDPYDRLDFTDEDRALILELMTACRLMLHDTLGEGFIIPDLLETARFDTVSSSAGCWRYSADYLPEKVLLHFIAHQYRSLDTRTGYCFRNRVTWRRGENAVILEAYLSPSGGVRPFILLRPADEGSKVTEAIATTLSLLLDDIFLDEGLGDVRRELKPASSDIFTIQADSAFVYRALRGKGRDADNDIRFTIVFDGIDLGSKWRSITGLSYLHTLIAHAGQPVHVRHLSDAANPDRVLNYRKRQGNVPLDDGLTSGRGSDAFAGIATKQLKRLLTDLEARLVNAELDEREQLEPQIKRLTDEIDRRSDPALKKLMNSVQQQLKKASAEIRQRMKDCGVPESSFDHFNHCTTSGDHPYHFCYRPSQPINWQCE